MKTFIVALLSLAALAGAEIYAPPVPVSSAGISRPGSSIGFAPAGPGIGLSGPGSSVGFAPAGAGVSGPGFGGPGFGGPGFGGPGVAGPSSFSVGFAPGAPAVSVVSTPSGSVVGLAPAPGSSGFAPGSSGFAPASASFTPGINVGFAPPPRVPASTYGPPGF